MLANDIVKRAIQSAILRTLIYSDIFDYPLTAAQIYRFLEIPVEGIDVEHCAAEMKNIDCADGYYHLAGRGEIVGIRQQREILSRPIFNRAVFYGRLLGHLPFVRMVGLTGSLAMLNISKNPDMDYMLVVKHGRVWLARAFAITLRKIMSLFGDTICPNLIVSENALAWPLHDLYSAHELCQMIPITGADVYARLFESNAWVKSVLPNAHFKTSEVFETSEVWRALEIPLRGKIGDRLEAWESARKIKKFSKQAGFGVETIFTADVCQGNFHHHRQWTHDAYQEKLSQLA